jgi:hypothetical protein
MTALNDFRIVVTFVRHEYSQQDIRDVLTQLTRVAEENFAALRGKIVWRDDAKSKHAHFHVSFEKAEGASKVMSVLKQNGAARGWPKRLTFVSVDFATVRLSSLGTPF